MYFMSEYKVVFYTRIDSGDQIKGYSLKGQEAILKNWSEEKKWKWVKTYSEEADVTDTNRQKLQEMIQDSKNGLFDGICIVDNDRLSKSTKFLLTIIDDLINFNVKIHIYNLQHLDIYSQTGRFTLTNFAAFSEFYKKQLAIKIKTGLKEKMKTEWFGKAPFGYKILSDIQGNRKKNTRLVVCPEEQEIIQIIKNLRNEGKSYSEIAEYLNFNGYKTRHTKTNNKTHWYGSTIRNILLRSEIKIE